MKNKKTKFSLLISTYIIINLVLGFTAMLNIYSFKDNYIKSLASTYSLVANQGIRKIEYSLKYGKELDNFFDMDSILKEINNNIHGLNDVFISLIDNSVKYNLNKNNNYDGFFTSNNIKFEYTKNLKVNLYENKYYVSIPIRDKEDNWIGSMNLVFDGDLVNERIGVFSNKILNSLILISLISSLVIIFLLANIKKIDKNTIFYRVLTVLILAQIIYGFINYNILRGAYTYIAEENTNFVMKTLSQDIETVIKKGVLYTELNGIDNTMEHIMENTPEIEYIVLLNDNKEIIYGTDEHIDDTSTSIKMTLIKDPQGKLAYLHIDISKSYLKNRLREILLDTATIFVVSIFFMIEMLVFLLIIVENDIKKELNEIKRDKDNRTMARTLAFLFFIFSSMSISFIPIKMNELYRPLFGFSREVTLGIPISCEMLLGGIFTVLAGYIIDKKGYKKVLIFGVFIFSIGSFLSAISSEAIVFILSRCIVGIGSGLSLIGMSSYVNSARNEKTKSEGMAAWSVGISSGVNCGVVIGGMLGERIGFSNVFYIISFGTLFVIIFIKKFIKTDKEIFSEDDIKTKEKIRIWGFIMDRYVITFLLFIIIPMAICGMFLDYYLPVLVEKIGASYSNVGRAFLLNGIVVIFFSQILTKFLVNKFNFKVLIIASSIITIIALLQFSIRGTLMSAFITAILLGVSDSFGITAQNNYYTGLESCKKLSISKSLGFFNIIRKIGQFLGPIIFGSVFVYKEAGVGYIGIGFIFCLVLFIIMTRKKEVTVQNG